MKNRNWFEIMFDNCGLPAWLVVDAILDIPLPREGGAQLGKIGRGGHLAGADSTTVQDDK